MYKVTYFDVEFANSKNKSICQMGIVCEDYETGEPYYPELNIYIDPNDGFDNMCVRIHGITEKKVKGCPTFVQAWNDLEKYFTNTILIGHNVAGSDIDALIKNLDRYNISIPEIYYICTLDLARKYIPAFAVDNHRLGTLCEYFDIDIDSEHDAFDDACANADLFKTLVETYDIDISKHIRKYIPHEHREFEQYLSSPMIRKEISELYGVIRGFSLDGIISEEEIAFISAWRDKFIAYTKYEEIKSIISIIDTILEDGIVTIQESFRLQQVIKEYLNIVATSPVTLATQILNGIMEGIVVDGKITTEESENLRLWLYDNIYLSGHYPFDKIINVLEEALKDGVISSDESTQITNTIKSILNPVEDIKTQIYSLEGKSVCLSGNFSYGSKAKVEEYIKAHGGNIDSSVKKTTNILVVGDCECLAYSNGTYGTKIKKAMEYQAKGCGIEIVKERDLIK